MILWCILSPKRRYYPDFFFSKLGTIQGKNVWPFPRVINKKAEESAIRGCPQLFLILEIRINVMRGFVGGKIGDQSGGISH